MKPMTFAEIDNLPASRETDIMVMQDVFGLEPREGDTVTNYSTNNADALDVALLLSGSVDWDEYPFEMHRNYADKPTWTASFNDYQFEGEAETFALAIIRAALKVAHADDKMACGHAQSSAWGMSVKDGTLFCLQCETESGGE